MGAEGTARAVWNRAARVALLVLVLALVPTATGASARALRGGPAGAGWWQPPAHLTWYWQLQGTVNNGEPVAAYDIDGFENGAAEVAALHARAIHVVCYIDVGTAERFRPDYAQFPAAVLGRSNGWPGERWLDIRRLDVIEPIMAARFRMCAEKGFDAIEPDNIEAFSNRSGFPVTAQQQLTFNEWVAAEAHALGLAVLQKNDGEQAAALQPAFDGALSEQCNQYRECASFAPYLAAGKPVLNAEYHLSTSRFCAADAAAGIVGARFNLALNGRLFTPCA
ncbi:MAG TPA: endo alpha-1,4 polygalactosaminidase [Solirubrobacteraceae bacterium]